jgi:type II secretory pathway pseudopilin PulG
MRKRNPGYSLIEVLTVVALTMIGSSAAVVQMKSSRTSLEANVAASAVIDQLKLARESAINERRNVRVEFISPSTIQVSRIENDKSTTVLSTATLPAGYTFGLPAGITLDTQDGYGNATPVYFKGANRGLFLGNGSLTNDAGIVISGSVFTIGSGGDATARAVTISGANGRTKQYYIQGSGWVERK